MFKYRLKLRKSQAKILQNSLESCRILYNKLLEERKTAWEKEKRSLTRFDQIKRSTVLRRESSEIKKVHSLVIQNVAVRVDLAYESFFRRCKNKEKPGYPRFKGMGRYSSLTFPQYGNGIKIENNILTVSKVGKMKIILHRPIEGTIKTATLIKSPTGKWYVSFACETPAAQLISAPSKSVGIDMGIKTFAVLSDGQKIENPRFFEKSQKRLAKEQKRLSENKESRKLRKRIVKIHERISFERHNFAHQESRRIINNYDLICVEDLKINSMTEKNWCNKQIYDVGWRMFLDCLSYKAEDAGKMLVKINPAYTSQDCSNCGNRQILKLSERTFDCPQCGTSIDRDLNASKNILRLGLKSLEAIPRSPRIHSGE